MTEPPSQPIRAVIDSSVTVPILFAEFALELDIDEVKAEVECVVGTGEAEFVEPKS